MKLSSAMFTSSLLAIAAIAAPLTAQRKARHNAHRVVRVNNRGSHPPYKNDTNEILHSNKTEHVEYTTNWAGAVLIGTYFTSVTAEFTVPTPEVPSGGSSGKEYCVAAWVGIDGDTCTDAILQTGVDFCVNGNSISYSAWYEWYPDYAYDFSDIAISAGNVIKVTVNASSKTSGTATVENKSTGKSVAHTFNGGVWGALCGFNAEWIVEDFERKSSLVPVANFGTVTFSNAEATYNDSVIGPDNATLMDIKQKDKILTSSSITPDSVIVKYV
ncbi:hypothetical protein PENSTE_c011G10162 [Penicillium steckii]|uniref:Aspergillopepsin-2 n=1 Tax=Penicillium steckii TaxID=303698 RepID=A0A1V6T5L6_9EURO|nr:hypothetical protein PENSTE_c011G10162 [Penicillium steckii]